MKRALTNEEWSKLVLAPIYVTLLALNYKGKISIHEKKEAIELVHLRTFTSHIDLRKYYKDAEVGFKENLDSINNKLPAGIKERREALTLKLEQLQLIISKLDENYQNMLNDSLQSFAKHILHVEDNFLQGMTIPIFIDYINKKIDKQNFTKSQNG